MNIFWLYYSILICINLTETFQLEQKNVNVLKNDKHHAETKLNNINVFFSAYGSLVAGFFSILHYFYEKNPIFNILILMTSVLTITIVYVISYSEKISKLTRVWKYTNECAEAAGILNPIMLTVSIMLSAYKKFEMVLICGLMIFIHFIIYLTILIKQLKEYNVHFKNNLCIFIRKLTGDNFMSYKKGICEFLCTEIKDYSVFCDDISNKKLKNRVNISLNYYIWNANFYKNLNLFFSIISIILPSLATFISCEAFGKTYEWVIPAITAITAVISSLLALLKCSEKQKSYRDSAESLKSELNAFHNKTGKYIDNNEKTLSAEQILSEEVEKIIQTGYSKISSLENKPSGT